MQRKLPIYYSIYAVALLIHLSCSNTRFLADDQLLYEGKNKVVLKAPDKLKNQKFSFYKKSNYYFRSQMVKRKDLEWKPNENKRLLKLERIKKLLNKNENIS